MTEFNRRATDKLPLDIDNMILQEDDLKQRAFLIVLNSINKSLMANTETIREVSEKLESHLENFDSHTREEDARLNKGRGAWKILAWVVGVAQVMAIGIWNEARSEIKQINATLAQIDTRVSVIESKDK